MRVDWYSVLEVMEGVGISGVRTPPDPVHVTATPTPGSLGMSTAEFSLMSQNRVTDSLVYRDPVGSRVISTESITTAVIRFPFTDLLNKRIHATVKRLAHSLCTSTAVVAVLSTASLPTVD